MKRAVAFLALAACGGSSSDAAKPDAGASVVADAGARVGAADAAEPSTVDAAAPAPTNFCSKQQATLCDDFDDGTLGQGWYEAHHFLGATLTVTNKALVMYVPPGADASRGCTLHATHGAPTKSIDVEFDIAVDQRPNPGESDFDFIAIYFTDPTSGGGRELQLQLNADGTSTLVLQGSAIANPFGQPTTANLAPGRFNHVALHVDIARKTYNAKFDGTDVGTIAIETAGGFDLYYGDSTLGATTAPWNIRTDNFVLRVE